MEGGARCQEPPVPGFWRCCWNQQGSGCGEVGMEVQGLVRTTTDREARDLGSFPLQGEAGKGQGLGLSPI